MADEPKKEHPEDIESILTDLDAILTDMGGEPKAKPAPAAAPVPPPAAEVKLPPKVEMPVAPPPVAAAPPPPPVAATPPPPPAPKPQGIELAPREGMITPSEPARPVPPPKPVEPVKPPEPPKPAPVAAAPPPAPAPAPAPVAAPPPAAAPVAASVPPVPNFPADAPKEQIRRVAYIYTSSCSEAKAGFAAFLSQAARTISKKPLYLREVLAMEVGAASDPNALVEKARQAKAVAILAVAEGWPPNKIDDLSEACSRANLLFRSVAPGDAQKKSTAVDIIVDRMLLPGEG